MTIKISEKQETDFKEFVGKFIVSMTLAGNVDWVYRMSSCAKLLEHQVFPEGIPEEYQLPDPKKEQGKTI